MTTDPIIQDSDVVSNARRVINYIDKINNTEVTGENLHELETQIRTLVEACNSKLLKAFPAKIISEIIDKLGFEIRSAYNLKFSEVLSFVIDSLRLAENAVDSHRCLDALRVLLDYCNIVVYSRFGHGLILEELKNIDENWSSSNVISTHWYGEDSCIT